MNNSVTAYFMIIQIKYYLHSMSGFKSIVVVYMRTKYQIVKINMKCGCVRV